MTVTFNRILIIERIYLLNEKNKSYIFVIVLPCKTYANLLIYTVFGCGLKIKFWQNK